MPDNRYPVDQHEISGESSSQEAMRSLLNLVRVARHRQNTVLGVLSVALLIGIGYYAVAPRYYSSNAKLMVIEQKGDNISGVSDQAGAENVMATHKELVRSPVVVARAIEGLAPEYRVDLIDTPPREWVKSITGRLSTTTMRRTNFIEVGYESLDPEAAAAVVQSIIEAYLAFVEETHRGTAGQVLNVLTVERDDIEKELAAKQQILHQSRERVGHLNLPDREGVVDPIIARALKINESLIEAQQQRLDMQSSLATLQMAMQRGDDLRQYVALVQETVGERMMLAAIGLGGNDLEVLADQQSLLLELRAERERLIPFYGDSHPEVVSLNKRIASTGEFLASYHGGANGHPGALPDSQLGPLLVSMLEQGVAQSQEHERQLTSTFESARQIAARQSGDFVKLDMLEREVKRLEKLHDLLFEKIAAVDIHQVQAPVRATIVKEPLPSERPSSPRLRFVLVASVCGGLALGIAIAWVQDLIDDRFGSPEEMAAQLGCRVLAVIRELAPKPGEGIEKVVMYSDQESIECEAFRTLRASIVFDSNASDRLVISSSEPSDGKTTVSSNLAVSYALSGKRTLIIDADLRKPGLSSLLELKGCPGLTDILCASGSIDFEIERCLHRTPLENLHVIPAGPRRPDPAELLLGPNLAELLAWADGRYDQILLDCPPVLAVADAQIVARHVEGVVLVVTPDKNHRRLVARACDAFLSSGATLLGLVANRVSERRDGYGYGYGYGYGHEEESPLEGDHFSDSYPKAA